MRPLIIERPDLQTSSQRYGNISITVACWMVWLYLFVPLLSLLAWVTGATLVYEVLYMDLGEGLVISRVLSYGKGIAVLTGIYSVWAIYNYVRWSGVERRQTPELVTTEEMAETFRVTVERVEELRNSKVQTLGAEELASMFGEQEEDLEERLEQQDTTEAEAA
jgi:biofilm PGA synthesis protein PgaD